MICEALAEFTHQQERSPRSHPHSKLYREEQTAANRHKSQHVFTMSSLLKKNCFRHAGASYIPKALADNRSNHLQKAVWAVQVLALSEEEKKNPLAASEGGAQKRKKKNVNRRISQC